MEIRFISSLTPEDENRFAPALLTAIGSLLDQFAIAYTMRIETIGAKVFQHSHPVTETEHLEAPRNGSGESIVSVYSRAGKPVR